MRRIERCGLWLLAIFPAFALSANALLLNWRIGLMGLAVSGVLIFALSFIPGRKRFLATLLLSLAGVAGVALYTGTWQSAVFALLGAVSLLMGVRELVGADPLISGMRGLSIGTVMYTVAGIVQWFTSIEGMNAALCGGAAAFLVVSAFLLNGESLRTGYVAHKRLSPPRGMTRANRFMLAVLLAIIAVVAYFDQIRLAVGNAAKFVVLQIARFIVWLGELFPKPISQNGLIEGGGQEAFPMGEAGEPSLIAEILYYVAMVFAFALLAFLLYKGAKVAWRKLYALLLRIAEAAKRFAHAVGEDSDERESLFDSAELRRTIEQSVRKRLNRLLVREKRWEQMDARERMRWIVRHLYRRSGSAVPQIESLTIHEAAPSLNIGKADPRSIALLYDEARYSERQIDEDAVEAVRKAVKS